MTIYWIGMTAKIECLETIKGTKSHHFKKLKAEYLKTWLNSNVPPNSSIDAWGFGKFARRQIKYLIKKGVKISSVYEVDCKKILNSRTELPIKHFKRNSKSWKLLHYCSSWRNVC